METLPQSVLDFDFKDQARCDSPAKSRLEQRSKGSPKNLDEINQKLMATDENRKVVTDAIAQKAKTANLHAAEVVQRHQKVLQESNENKKIAIDQGLRNAEEKRQGLLASKGLSSVDKSKQVRARIEENQEAGRSRAAKLEERLNAAVEKHENIVNEISSKNAEKVAHAKAVAAQVNNKDSSEELKSIEDKLAAAETKRTSLMEQKVNKNADLNQHAKDVAAQVKEAEMSKAAQLRESQAARLAEAEARRQGKLSDRSSSPTKKQPSAAPMQEQEMQPEQVEQAESTGGSTVPWALCGALAAAAAAAAMYQLM